MDIFQALRHVTRMILETRFFRRAEEMIERVKVAHDRLSTHPPARQLMPDPSLP